MLFILLVMDVVVLVVYKGKVDWCCLVILFLVVVVGIGFVWVIVFYVNDVVVILLFGVIFIVFVVDYVLNC